LSTKMIGDFAVRVSRFAVLLDADQHRVHWMHSTRVEHPHSC
jgi:hypothetical protein